MEISGIKIICNLFGPTDFDHLSRKYATKILRKGIPLTIEVLEPVGNMLYANIDRELVNCVAKQITYNVVICFSNPLIISKKLREEAKECCRIAFVNDDSFVLHKPWGLLLNAYSDFIVINGVNTIQETVNKKIITAHYPLDSDEFLIEAKNVQIVSDRLLQPLPKYIFYTNFIYGKHVNIESLLDCYFKGFSKEDGTCFIISTTLTTNKKEDVDEINSMLFRLAAERGNKHLPNVLVMFDLSLLQRKYLHNIGDCYINPLKINGFSMDCVLANINTSYFITHNEDSNLIYKSKDIETFCYNVTKRRAKEEEVFIYNDSTEVVDIDKESLLSQMRRAFNCGKKKIKTNNLSLNGGVESLISVITKFNE